MGEDVQSDEMNKRAAACKPPFFVTRQQVDWYRKHNGVRLNAIIAADQESALTTGYAVKETRVRKLNELAERIEQSVIDRLWVPDVKGVGSGEAAQIVDFEYFNKAGVDAYRGVLDDIAAEVGGRVKNVDVKSGGEKIVSPETLKPSEIAERVAALLVAKGK